MRLASGMIEAALEQIDQAASPEEIAAAAARRSLPVGDRFVMGRRVAAGQGRILAAEGRAAQALGPGR